MELSNPFKRRNEGPAATEAKTPEVVSDVPQIPPKRRFRVSTPAQGGYTQHAIDAHDYTIGKVGELVFFVFFFFEGDLTKPAQAPRVIFAPGEWRCLEELNPDFDKV